MVDDSSTLNLHRQAIQAALNCQWDQALEINQQLISDEPNNIECLNRIAKAYFELGKYTQAKKIYEEVLEIDPYNPIAQKNLKRVSSFKKDGVASNGAGPTNTLSAEFFLQEPGITKSVTLIKVAEPQKLLTLSAGQIVNLVPKSRGISVTDYNNNYLGVLPDDTAHHLLKLIAGGNRYQAFIKSLKSNSLTLIIREVFRSKKFKNQASFLDDAKILSYSSDNLSLLAASNDQDAPEDTSPDVEENSI
jgi:hypothetical protein